MAEFIPSAKTAQDFNNGQKYINGEGTVTGDALDADMPNNVIEGFLYTQGLATNPPDTSEAGNVGTPSVTVITASDGSARLKFANLKGATGGKGDKGDKGDSASIDTALNIDSNNAIANSAVTASINTKADKSQLPQYVTCDTAASTATKTVEIPGFTLVAGVRLTVKFTNSNTANSPKLNVNNTGAKSISADGDTTYVKWTAAETIDFVYDGTAWIAVGGYRLAGMRVGAIYISDSNTSPTSLFGGSWTPITGRFLLAYDDVSTAPTYSSTTQYHANDIVYYSSGNWICKKDVKGITPSTSNSAYWAKYGVGYEGGSANAVVVKHGGHIRPDGVDAGTVSNDTWEVAPSNNSYYIDTNKINQYGTTRTFMTEFGNEVGFRTQYRGEDGTGKNMPPYRVEYMWYRTA